MATETFSTLARLWADEKRPYIKKSTDAAYSYIVHYYLEGRFSYPSDFNRESLQKFASELLGRGLSVKTTRDILLVAKMILNFKEAIEGRAPSSLRLRLSGGCGEF